VGAAFADRRASERVMAGRLVIWGASGHARVVADIVRLQGEHELVGFLDALHPERRGAEFCGASILGGAEELETLHAQRVDAIICGMGDGPARLWAAEQVRAHGYRLATAVHPRATIARDVVLGAGTVVAAGAIVNPAAVIGENVVINTGATVDHECVVGDGAMIGVGAHLAGSVTVGRAAVVEIGTIVAARLAIGEGTVVGAGSLVLHDVPAGVLAYGRPARVVRPLAP
jgi:UDP-N-acetylbacillosamine N-acetyltransferase